MKLILPHTAIAYSNLRKQRQFHEDDEINALFSFIHEWYGVGDSIQVKTSGSTGTPKNIRLNKQHIKNSAQATYHYFEPWNNLPLLLALPMQYVAAKLMVVRALEYNLPLIWVQPSSRPLTQLKQQVQFAALVPNQVSNCLNDLNFKKVQNLIIGGAPVTAQLEKKLQSVSTRCFATYGMTETATHVALRPLNGSNKSNVFTFMPGISGSVNSAGCLVIHAPSLGVEALETNDMVTLQNNTFRWLGRKDFTINSGGLKIHPEELERKLDGFLNYPFYFWSEPDPVLGERLIIIVENEPGATNQELLLSKLRERLKDSKYLPKRIYEAKKFKYSQNKKLLRENTFNESKRINRKGTPDNKDKSIKTSAKN